MANAFRGRITAWRSATRNSEVVEEEADVVAVEEVEAIEAVVEDMAIGVAATKIAEITVDEATEGREVAMSRLAVVGIVDEPDLAMSKVLDGDRLAVAEIDLSAEAEEADLVAAAEEVVILKPVRLTGCVNAGTAISDSARNATDAMLQEQTVEEMENRQAEVEEPALCEDHHVVRQTVIVPIRNGARLCYS